MKKPKNGEIKSLAQGHTGLEWFVNQSISDSKFQAFEQSPLLTPTHMPQFKISSNQKSFQAKIVIKQ